MLEELVALRAARAEAAATMAAPPLPLSLVRPAAQQVPRPEAVHVDQFPPRLLHVRASSESGR